MVFNGSNEVTAYDPQAGEELWNQTGTTIESIPMIAASGGLLFSALGRNGPIFALRPDSSDKVTDSSRVWRLEHGGPHVTSPMFHDGRHYIVSDTGIAMCLSTATGKTLWQERLRGPFSASPLLIGDKLLLISEEDITYVFKSGRSFEQLGENQLSETMFATPAEVGGRMYFRSTTGLVCVGR